MASRALQEERKRPDRLPFKMGVFRAAIIVFANKIGEITLKAFTYRVLSALVLTFSCLTTAQAALIKMDFTVTGFDIIHDSNAAPTDPVSGSIVWQAASVNSTINSLISIDLTLNGYTYTLAEVGFISPFDPITDIIGAQINSVSGVGSTTNDFLIVWDRVNLQGFTFVYASSTLSGLWESVNFTSFSVTAVPLPGAAWLFGSGLLGLIGMAKRKR